MKNLESNMFSPEKMAENNKQRIISDNELVVEKGAEVTKDGGIIPSENEQKKIKFEEEDKIAKQKAKEFVESSWFEGILEGVEEGYGHTLKVTITEIADDNMNPTKNPDMFTSGGEVYYHINIHDEDLFNNNINEPLERIIVTATSDSISVNRELGRLSSVLEQLNTIKNAKEELEKAN